MTVQLRLATFADAKEIDRIVAALPQLSRDLHGWVNAADFHVAAVEDDGRVVGFAAKRGHADHPQRDLATVWVEPRDDARSIADALYDALKTKKAKPLKLRIPADDLDADAIATARGFVRRVTSATYLVDSASLEGPTDAIEYDYVPADVLDGFRALYTNTHRWDPPRYFSRRHIRRTLLAGAAHIIAIRDMDGGVVAVGAAHPPSDDSVAADIALAGACEPTAADADDLTAQVLSALASFYDDQPLPLWFEVDDGYGSNEPLFRAITATGATPRDAVAIYTSD